MALDPTARLANVKDSLKKYFIDNLYTDAGISVSFDKGLSVPDLQGTAVTRWVVIMTGAIELGNFSTLNLPIYCCTRKDPEGFRLAQLRDKLIELLTDPTDIKRITLYRSYENKPWEEIGKFLVTQLLETPDFDGPDETKYRMITVVLRWATKA